MGDLSRRDDAPAPVPVDPATLPALEVDELVKETEELLVARAVAYGREYKRVEGVGTLLLKNIAAVAVALRKQYDDPKGKSHEYRQLMAQIYRDAGVDEKTQTAVRYHLGNLLRRTMTTRELEAEGLLTTSPLERLQDNRKATSRLLNAARVIAAVDVSLLDNLSPAPVEPAKTKAKAKAKPATKAGKSAVPAPAEPTTTGVELKATADAIRLAAVANGIVSQLDATTVDEHMTDGQRAKLDAELEAMQTQIRALRRHTRQAKPKA